jgi:hypothetical protein
MFLLGVALGPAWVQSGIAGVAPPASVGDKPAYVLVLGDAKRVHDALTYEFKAPKLRADDWVVYVARLPELPGQTAVRSSLAPGGRTGRDLSALGRPLLVTRVAAQGTRWRDGMTVRVEYDATLRERRLERLAPDAPTSAPVPALAPGERRLALAAGHQFDFETLAFQRWLDASALRRNPEESEVDFARRAFLAIKNSFKSARADPADLAASRVCQAGQSDSGGLSILYVTTLRANRIPARARSGRWALPTEEGRNPLDEPHVKTEFFVTGIGWVPVDIASAVQLDKAPDGVDYFGIDDANFLTLHVDTDLVLDTLFFGRKTMTWLQGASFWVNGSGTLEGVTAPVTSDIRVDPVDPARPRTPGTASTPAAPETRPKEQSAAGIVIDKGDNWLSVRSDGEEEPVKYELPSEPGRTLRQDWQGIFTVARVRLVFQPVGAAQQLVSIKKQVPRSAGIVTGEVVHNNGWWVDVKPKNGPPEGYAAHFPFEKSAEVMARLKELTPGDVVTIQFITDFERHRIDVIRKR